MKEIKIDNNFVIKVEESLYEKIKSEVDQIFVLSSLLDVRISMNQINEDDKTIIRGLHTEFTLEKYESVVTISLIDSVQSNPFFQRLIILGFHNKKHKPVHKVTFKERSKEAFSCSIYKSLLPIQMFKEKI